MDFKEFDSRLKTFLRRYVSVGDAFVKANPEWILAAGYQMIEIAIRRLQHDIDDPENRHVSWQRPVTVVLVGVDNVSEGLEPVPFRVTLRNLQDKKTAARATLAAFARTKTCFLLSTLSQGVAILRQDGQYYVCFPSRLERELERLSRTERARREQELVAPKPTPFEFKFRGTWKDGKAIDLNAKFEVTFSPLHVDYDSQQTLYPVWIRMILSGTDPKRWGKEFKALFWKKIIQMWRSRVPKENLECLLELRREMRLARVVIEELVDPEHARDYREFVQSFANWEAQKLEKTGRFEAPEGPLPLAKARAQAQLKPKQRRDYLKYDYLRYDTVRVPATPPVKRSNLIVVGERSIRMGDSDLALLLRLTAELTKGKGGWVHINDLVSEKVIRAGGKYQAFGRLRKALQSALPAAATLEMVEGDDSGRFRLSVHPDFVTRNLSIRMSREAIRRLLRSSGLYARAPRRVERHRERREPMEREGQMSQMDTSQHRWIPALGLDSYLVMLVDDVTNKLQAGKFVASDSTVENMVVLKGSFRSKGLPGMIYLDRDSKFKTTRHGGRCYQVGEEQPETQIERALGELGVGLIYAHSPQAKGRVERDFRTLQDRLLKELRVGGIETLEEANHYLIEDFMPRWNRRFARAPRADGAAYAWLLRGCHLDDVLCLKYDRRVYPDNTISYRGRKIQILADPYRANYSRARVELWEHLDGKITILHKGRRLRYRRVPGPTPKHRDDRLREQDLLDPDISTLQRT